MSNAVDEKIQRVDVIHADIYRRQLQIEKLEAEIADLMDEREGLLEFLERESDLVLKVRDIDERKVALDAQRDEDLPVKEMIRILLWERFDEGMTAKDIICDIQARWGNAVAEASIRKELWRMQFHKKRKRPELRGEIWLIGDRYEITHKPSEIDYGPEEPERSGSGVDEGG